MEQTMRRRSCLLCQQPKEIPNEDLPEEEEAVIADGENWFGMDVFRANDQKRHCWAPWSEGTGTPKRHMAAVVASEAVVEYDSIPMVGKLDLSQTNGSYGTLNVPDVFMKAVYEAIKEPGMEPSPNGAHISVFDDEEMEALSLPLPENGSMVDFRLRSIESVEPEGWDEMERVWFVTVDSEELERLRKRYGFTPLMHESHPFHITVAVRKNKK